jgi:protein-disulfide isomerase
MSRRVDQKRASNRIVREQLARERRVRRNRWITIGAVVVLVIAGLVGFAVYQSQKKTTYAIPSATTNDGSPNTGLLVGGDGPVTVEVYLDFQCPVCKNFETTVTPTLNQLIDSHKIRLVWHPVNILDGSSSGTHYSSRAGSSAGCAVDAPGNKLKAYGEALFANQPPEGGTGLTDDQIIDIAGSAGINTPEFAQCVRGQKYVDWVDNVTNSMFQRGYNATPTVLVNGKQVPNPTAENVQAAVAAAG